MLLLTSESAGTRERRDSVWRDSEGKLRNYRVSSPLFAVAHIREDLIRTISEIEKNWRP